ncbi:hypothetical protein HK405_008859 [Cladochytrium tenue]|nr:hypothetical protein HK405_008859 [Cladochytrium tenue]
MPTSGAAARPLLLLPRVPPSSRRLLLPPPPLAVATASRRCLAFVAGARAPPPNLRPIRFPLSPRHTPPLNTRLSTTTTSAKHATVTKPQSTGFAPPRRPTTATAAASTVATIMADPRVSLPQPPQPPRAAAPHRLRPYADASVFTLLNSYAVLQLCAFRPLVDWSDALLGLAARLRLSWAIEAVIKRTFFAHFCGGEDLDETVGTMRRLEAKGIGSILDLAMEADETGSGGGPAPAWTPKSCDAHAARMGDLMLEAVNVASRSELSYLAVKVTAFAPPVLLVSWSTALSRAREAFLEAAGISGPLTQPDSLPHQRVPSAKFKESLSSRFPSLRSDGATLDAMVSRMEVESKSAGAEADGSIDWFGVTRVASWTNLNYARAMMAKAELADLVPPVLAHLDRLAAGASSSGVRLMIDAEQTYFQPAIDDVTRILMAGYNKGGSSASPTRLPVVIYNTYQMYLRDTYGRLAADLDGFKRLGLPFGAKVVRGAYMDSERRRAAERGQPDPIHPNVDATHAAYDAAVGLLISHATTVDAPAGTPRVELVVASHNKASVRKAASLLKSAGASTGAGSSSNVPLVAFAQLMGMQDETSCTLVEDGLKVYKYVPYGPVKVTIPYLLRRAKENSAALGGAAEDRANLLRELRHRIGFA